MTYVSAKYCGMPLYIGLSRHRFKRDASRPVAVEVGEELLVFPSRDVQCIARTKTGKRCQNVVVDLAVEMGMGISLGAYYMPPFGARFEVFRAVVETDGQAGPLLRQRCRVHDEKPDAVDYVAPEWYHFDPARDTDMLVPSWSGSAHGDTIGLCTALDASVGPWEEAIESGASDPDAIAQAVATAIQERLSRWLKENRRDGHP